MGRWIAWTLTVALALSLSGGCAGFVSGGRIERVETRPDGVRVETRVVQPANPNAPAMLTDSLDAGVKASTGTTQGVDQAIAQLAPLTWAGVALIILGVGSIFVRAYLPVVPISASFAAIGVGAGLLFLPTVIDRSVKGPVIWIAVACAVGVGVLYAIGWFDNRVKLKPAGGVK